VTSLMKKNSINHLLKPPLFINLLAVSYVVIGINKFGSTLSSLLLN
jgi:hypothetical protein